MTPYYTDPDNRYIGSNEATVATTQATTYEQQRGPGISILNRWLSIYSVILFIVAAIVVVGVITHLNRASASPQIGQVNITSTQFSPATIHIKTGMTVTWTNTDTQEHQVAADPYPSDSSVPGFDNKLLLMPRDTNSYTFQKNGTYTFHDEINPYQVEGTVIVD